MPRIVGLITRMPKERAEAELLQMLKTLWHDPFSYVMGTWVDESLGVYVGWTVRRNSFSDGMPLFNEREDIALVFSGEDFPQPDITRLLKDKGHSLNLQGPSYLVHLYEEDSAFPKGLNGRFHGLLVDRARRTAMLFIDRYGMHRIYYHESKDAFYFGAEAKAILAVCTELRRPNLRGLGEFVACGCALENRTLFEGINVLPGGAAWVFQNGAVERKGTYFQPREWEDQDPLEPESYYKELRGIFSRNLPRYFTDRERIGMSLTGGRDSRIIMAWQSSPPGSLPCYSFAGMYHDCQDVLLARQIARACGQPHEVIQVGEEFLAQFSRYAERTIYLTDGCVNVSHTPDLYVNERAARIAPVRMTGNYGGEVLRRVRAFKPMEPTLGLFQPEFLPYIHTAGDTYARLLQGNPLSFAVFRQAPWHHYGLLGLEQTQLTLRTPYLDNEFVGMVFRAPESFRASSEVSLRLIADGNPALCRIRTDRGLGGDRELLLAAVSRAFIGFTVKAEYAYDYGMPNWIARIDHLLSSFHLERLFLGRHKFYHFRVWYRDFLSEYVREMLLDPRTLSRPYLQRSTLEAVVRSHLKGDRNYTTAIHQVLTLELIHRLFLDPR